MRSWAILLGGLLVWAGHFFLLYGIGEFVGASPESRGAVLILSMLALLADVWLARRLIVHRTSDVFGRWRADVALGGLALSALAVIWQALPALIG